MAAAKVLLQYSVFCEETTQLIDIVAYNKRDICVDDAGGGRYKVKVDGVGEGRPSVMRGDRILLQAGPQQPAFGGRVHFVNCDEVVFTMPREYSNARYPTMDLIFLLPRSQERSYHRTIASSAPWFLTNELCLKSTVASNASLHMPLTKKEAVNLDAVEGDDSSPSSIPTKTTSTTFYDFRIPHSVHEIALNEKQSEFVAHVLNLERRVSMLWGPPGTGKTTALVAAIAEVVAAHPDRARVLAVCPSNDASDLIIERLQRYISYINQQRRSASSHPIKVIRVHSLSRAAKASHTLC